MCCASEMHLENTEGRYWTDWYQCCSILTAFCSHAFSCLCLIPSNFWKSDGLSRQ